MNNTADVHHMFEDKGLSGAPTPDPISQPSDGDWGWWGWTWTEKGGENGLSTGAWEAVEYEGDGKAPAQQPDGQQMTSKNLQDQRGGVGGGAEQQNREKAGGLRIEEMGFSESFN